ncbi:MAG: ATPase, T2SS/T4P/T4SS family [Gammaproteobacteria bacterium]|nr:ATPase, T2SS/T4P/T4SS family [Gammaproteobacteria bacterium]
MISPAEQKSENVVRTRIGVMTCLAPRKRLDSEGMMEHLSECVDECTEVGEDRIVLDLASVQAIDSTSIEQLLDINDKLIHRGGWLKLTRINSLLKEIFSITGVSHYIPCIDDNDETISTHEHLEPKKARLGDILVNKGVVSEARIEEAIQLQRKLGRRMGQIIVDKGWAPERVVLEAVSEQLGLAFVNLRTGLCDVAVARELGKDICTRLKLLPLFKIRNHVTVATTDPQAIPALEEVEEHLQCQVNPVIAEKDGIFQLLNEIFSERDLTADLIAEVDDDFEVISSERQDDPDTIDELAAGSPVINLVNSIIQRAVQDGASDIHIEPSRDKTRIRLRMDGVLYEIMALRSELHSAVVSRLKVMSNLDISERRLPQDGRIQVHTRGRPVDLRFSSLPGLYGEKVVLRVLDKNRAILDINKLGMTRRNVDSFGGLLGHSYGLILVTGPTGSGKTTTLYAALNYLNSIEKNIVTIEDPVEYQVDIINQNEVRANIGLTFAKVLKHVLRQDPDIVMVGEIRERETAEIAVQAALTGHLVLSTLHTNDSIGAVTRMIDMGVEPYLLSSALIGVVAQRLVRTVCPSCKTTYLAEMELVERFGWNADAGIKLARGRGCNDCYDSGYKGRQGVHEVLVATESLQKLIISNPSRDQLDTYLREMNVATLFDDGLERVKRGETTLEEISRSINI